MFDDSHSIARTDPQLWSAIASEFRRQEEGIELIASENYASPAVLAAQGSVLTNKYAEGYPGKRYYGGCEFVDIAEQLAIDRVKKLFGAEYANVQPHSGSQANQAVYLSMLKPGDTILGMSLAHGGHLTHGASVNLIGQALQGRGLRIEREGRDRLRPGARPGEGASPAHDRGRRLGLRASDRLEEVSRDRRRGGRLFLRGHGALRGPRRRGPLSHARSASPTSSPARRTRRCAGRAAAWCSRALSTRRRSTPSSSRRCRAAR